MILISNDFWHKGQINNFDPYDVLLAIATSIPVLHMTGFVLQGHVSERETSSGLTGWFHSGTVLNDSFAFWDVSSENKLNFMDVNGSKLKSASKKMLV